jgi:hypothetical protein
VLGAKDELGMDQLRFGFFGPVAGRTHFGPNEPEPNAATVGGRPSVVEWNSFNHFSTFSTNEANRQNIMKTTIQHERYNLRV